MTTAKTKANVERGFLGEDKMTTTERVLHIAMVLVGIALIGFVVGVTTRTSPPIVPVCAMIAAAFIGIRGYFGGGEATRRLIEKRLAGITEGFGEQVSGAVMPGVRDLVSDATAPMVEALADSLAAVLPRYGLDDPEAYAAVMLRFASEWTSRFERRRAMNELLQAPTAEGG